jgi:hypothetical protein
MTAAATVIPFPRPSGPPVVRVINSNDGWVVLFRNRGGFTQLVAPQSPMLSKSLKGLALI